MGSPTPYQIQKVSRDKSIKRNKQFVENYLKLHSCVDCGNSDIRVLDFDHIKGEKFYDVSHLVTKAYKLDKIINEINKCEVRCANCHRIVTKERRLNKNQ